MREGEVTIYVRRRIIQRGGKKVEGWQASFQPEGRGGATDTDERKAIEQMRRVALAMNLAVAGIVYPARRA